MNWLPPVCGAGVERGGKRAGGRGGETSLEGEALAGCLRACSDLGLSPQPFGVPDDAPASSATWLGYTDCFKKKLKVVFKSSFRFTKRFGEKVQRFPTHPVPPSHAQPPSVPHQSGTLVRTDGPTWTRHSRPEAAVHIRLTHSGVCITVSCSDMQPSLVLHRAFSPP